MAGGDSPVTYWMWIKFFKKDIGGENRMKTDLAKIRPSKGGVAQEARTKKQRAMLLKLLSEGYAPAEAVAETMVKIGSERSEVNRELEVMMEDDGVLNQLQEVAWARMKASMPRAVSVLQGQLEDENAWVSQGAARMVLDYGAKMAEISRAPVIVFGDGMPEPGFPQSTDELEADEPADDPPSVEGGAE